jgi:hypothetical protein
MACISPCGMLTPRVLNFTENQKLYYFRRTL